MSTEKLILITEEELDKRIDYWLETSRKYIDEAVKYSGEKNGTEELMDFARSILQDTHEVDAMNLKRILRGGKINE